jgi:hypothetical protein
MSESERRSIVITKEDLRDPKIDEIIETERSYGPRVTEPAEQKRRFSLFYSSWFYLMLAGAIGAFAAWAIIEPYFNDGVTFTGRIESVQPGATPFGFYVKTFKLWGKIRVAGTDVYLVDGPTRLADQQGNLLPPSSYGVLQPGQIVKLTGEVAPDSTSFLSSIVWLQPDSTKVDETINLSALSLQQLVAAFSLFPLVAAIVGLFVGSVEGAICRTFSRAAWCGAIGLISGLIGGAISVFIGGIVFALIGMLGEESANPFESRGAFMLLVFRRGLGWTLAGMAMGLGQGFALKSRKLILNGLIGGMVGGLIGGLLFDPIYLVIAGKAMLRGGEASRAIGLTIIGGTVGLMIGFTEMLTRDAWLKVIQGPLRGKEFSFNRTPIRLGSSPKNEIYLFKDPKIDPIHAEIEKLRDTYEIVDSGSTTGTFINGQRVKSHRLMDGDVIRIGDSEFSYSMREKKVRASTGQQSRLSEAS